MSFLSSPLTISLLFGLSFLILLLFVIPGKQRLDVTDPTSKLNLRMQTQRALHRAGIFDQAPSILLLMGISLSVLVGVVCMVFLGEVYFALLGPVIVLGSFYWYLRGRQRRWIMHANGELVPFLNRVATSVSSGLPIQTAYVRAVDDSAVLREVLSDSAAQITSGGNFTEAILSTIDLVPFRMWGNFVRQIELYEQTGGDIGKSLATTVNQISKMQRLQAEARADFAAQVKQQRMIILIVLAFNIVAIFVQPQGLERTIAALRNPIGLVFIIIGILVMIFGAWFMSKQMKDIEKKLFF